ncbi:phosphatidate cytidylyltransferase [Chitinophaga silvatica]|uniref:Phosphatidate cytidylyltransferase n=1 Tax=Chitinophaga silvatica TaxID=2282649 RepID=A0A3E1YI95_9BACT|nr:phosphatidate cytidylyltransferase [Chitinophaga silvatica]
MRPINFYLLTGILFLFSSCQVIGGIFKAGVWTGIICVAVVVGLIVFLVTRGGKRN